MRATPPLGYQVEAKKTDITSLGTDVLVIRLQRCADGVWRVPAPTVNRGIIVFLNKTNADLPMLPSEFLVKVTDIQPRVVFAEVLE